MALRVLIVSPDAGFGGLIQQTLDNSGEYEPVLVVNGRQALELASKLPFDLAILDADMTGFDMVELGMALQVLSPKVCLILIPGSSSTDDLTQSGLRICGFLTKPFYLPDLLEVVGKASHSGLDEGPLGATTTSILAAQDTQNVRIPVATEELSPQLAESPAWLGNPDRAAQHLARLSMASASQAALILRMGRLWAYAGHLSQAAAQELAEIIQHDWQRQLTRSVPETKISDLVRFVRLRSTGEDTMLYATSLGEQLVLVLAFDVRTPISKIHSQAGELARALAASSEAELPLGQAVIPASAGEEPGRAPKPDQHPEPAKTPSKSAPSPGMPKSEVTAPAKQEAAMPSPPLEEQNQAAVPPLPIGDVPPPTPPEYQGELPRVETMHWPWELDPELDDQSEAGEDEPPRRSAEVSGTAGAAARMVPGAEAPPVGADRGEYLWTPGTSGEADNISYPLPEELHPVSKMILSSPVVYVIHYACVLLPRMPEHQLKGDIPALLTRWMRRISLVSGWRLEYVAVHAEYLHWIAGVAPEVPAVEVIHLVRQQTSSWLFAECPAYTRENPSNDFWAPGYLVLTGSRPLPPQLVNEYIRQTRTRQGVAGEN